jgi:hypothetical protein
MSHFLGNDKEKLNKPPIIELDVLKWKSHVHIYSTWRMMELALCSVEGCDRDSKSKGLCAKHYQKQRNAGTTPKIKKFNVKPCNAAGCEENALRLGFCQKHLIEWNFE